MLGPRFRFAQRVVRTRGMPAPPKSPCLPYAAAVAKFLRGANGFIDRGEQLFARAKQSIAPDLIRLSSARLFKTRGSTLSQNSKMVLNYPTRVRASRIARAVFSPTFLMAASRSECASPTGVKYRSLELTSGGRTVMPIPRASLMYFTTFSVLPVSEVSSAAMNSTG